MFPEFLILVLSLLFVYFASQSLMSRIKKKKKRRYNLASIGNPFVVSNRTRFYFLKPPSKDIPISTRIFETYAGWAEMRREEGMYHTRYGYRNVVVLYSGATVQPLLSSKWEINKSGGYKPARKFLGGGLLLSQGERWRKNRKLLSPAFNFNLSEEFLPVINYHSRILVEKLNAYVDEDFVDVTPLILLCAFDVILETSLGTRLMVQNNPYHPVLISSRRLFEIWTNRVFKKYGLFDSWFELTRVGREFDHHVRLLRNFVERIIKDRKRKLLDEYSNDVDRRKPFLDLLLTHQMNDQTSYSDSEIVAEINTFGGAGHDTTAMALIWCVYLLGLNRDVQDKVADEITRVLKGDRNKDIALEDIRQMKYLDRVLKECQRLYPSIPLISRVLRDNIKIGESVIPKRTIMVVLISSLHSDPNVFPNPEIFDPDRFLPENVSGRHPYAYAPFSAGPRNCPGQKFAILEEKIILADILRNFRVTSLEARDKIRVVPEIVGKPNKPIRIKLTRRK